jgi:hypothetical protein
MVLPNKQQLELFVLRSRRKEEDHKSFVAMEQALKS